MVFNVFVSYSAKDSERIRPILGPLKAIQDVQIFFADESIDPGAEISSVIINSIKGCDLFLVFYSDEASKSNYVQQEIGVAKSSQRMIIPILFDGTKPNAMLAGIHYLDLSDKDKYQAEISRLYDFITSNTQKKQQNQALAFLGLLGLAFIILSEK
jgi:hypothetical protein